VSPTEKAQARSILKSTYSGERLREALAAFDSDGREQITEARRRWRDALWQYSRVNRGVSGLKCSDDARRQALINARRYRLDCLTQAKFYRDRWFDLRRQEDCIEYGEAA